MELTIWVEGDQGDCSMLPVRLQNSHIYHSQLVHREAITHSQLNHSNILPLLGVFYEAARSPPILVLPFLEKGSLSHLVGDPTIERSDALFSRIVSQRFILRDNYSHQGFLDEGNRTWGGIYSLPKSPCRAW